MSAYAIYLAGGALAPSAVLAVPGWDCQQGKNGEWQCIAGKKASEPAERPTAKSDTPPKKTEPTDAPQQAKSPKRTEPEETPAEVVRPEPPVAAEKPVVQPAKPARAPVVAQPEEPPAKPQTLEESEAQHLQALRKDEKPTTGVDVSGTSPQAQPQGPSGQPGWNCRPGGKEWDCSLVGPDPKGLAHEAGNGAEGASSWASSSTMTTQDELRFRGMVQRLPKDPWSLSCGWHKTEYTKPTDFLTTPADRNLRERSPMEIRSNYAEMLKNEIADFKGAADLMRGDQRLSGDFVSHNTEAETITAQGNVMYQEKGLSFASDTAFLRMKTNEGVLRNTQFVVQTVPSRGSARVVHLDSKDVSRYDNITYTACPPGNQDWLLHASNTKIDRATGRAMARNAWLEFKGVPFLYSPIFTFPIDDRRQSGLLTPTFGTTSVGGFDLTVPYYFNLAPNYDLTFTPRLLTNRGIMFRGDFRYLTESMSGRIGGEILPHDDRTGDSRGSFRIQNHSRLTDSIAANLDINHVSDKRYLNELGNILSVPSNRHIPSYANVIHTGSNYSLEARGDYYETIDTTIASKNRPYRRLPALIAKYDEEIASTGLRFGGRGEMVSFDHPNAAERVTGQRFNARPRLYYPFQSSAGYITPSIAIDYTQYWLHWPDGTRSAGDGRSNSMSRTAPIFSVDSGAFFDRDFEIGGSPMQQTLEPRLFYLYVPKVKQDQIPIFDSNVYDFNFYQLFRENRFAGGDRLADSNQFTAALTTRLIEQSTGLERVRASIGDIFYFRDQTVTLPCDQTLTPNQALTDSQTANFSGSSNFGPSVSCTPVDKTKFKPIPGRRAESNIVGEIATQFTPDWSLRTTGQWNPESDRIDRGQVSLQYNTKANELINLSYRYRRDPITGREVVQQTDTSFRLPIADGWYLSSRWQYSLLNQVTVETFIGIERETCCWRLALVADRFLNGATTAAGTNVANSATTNNAFFVQFELKGLTRFGDQVDQFLTRNVNGFRGPSEVFGLDSSQQP